MRQLFTVTSTVTQRILSAIERNALGPYNLASRHNFASFRACDFIEINVDKIINAFMKIFF